MQASSQPSRMETHLLVWLPPLQTEHLEGRGWGLWLTPLAPSCWAQAKGRHWAGRRNRGIECLGFCVTMFLPFSHH